MAIEQGINPFSIEADENLAAYQYHAVNINSTTGKLQPPATTGHYALGILQNKPGAAGRAGSVQTLAGTITKAYVNTATAGDGIGYGTPLKARSDGKLEANTTGGVGYVLARALETCATSTTPKIITVMITHEGPNSSA